MKVAKLKEFLQNAQEIGVDGLIVADLGVFFEAKKVASKLNLHVSTQFGVVNHKTSERAFRARSEASGFSKGAFAGRHQNNQATNAIKFGADAICLGATSFGMMAVAANFNFDLLEESVKLAQSQGVKIYLTCNTIPLNDEVAKLKEFLQNAQEIEVDGLIVADLELSTTKQRTRFSSLERSEWF